MSHPLSSSRSIPESTFRLHAGLLGVIAATLMVAGTARAEQLLDIDPAPESRPGFSWAAVAEMIMVYYDVPNTGPADMQCSLAFYLTGQADCQKAAGETEFTATSRIVKGYPQYARESFGELPVAMRWKEARTLPPQEVMHEIAFERPVLVEIEPARNEGQAKIEKRVVLIVGTDGGADNLQLIINDPKAFGPGGNPYLEFGGRVRDQSGQYQIGYDDFAAFLKWTATLYAIKPD